MAFVTNRQCTPKIALLGSASGKRPVALPLERQGEAID